MVRNSRNTSNNLKINTSYTKISFLTFTIIWSLVFSLILSSATMAVDKGGSALVFAQGNETETEINNDFQKQNAPSIDEASKDNDEEKTIVGTPVDTPPIENCGINPNAPTCCTPGQDEGCVDTNVGEVTISKFNTIPQKISSQDEFRVVVTVTNNLNVPITYIGDMCGASPLNIQFDKNVNVYNAIACQAISTKTLNVHESAIVEGKGYEILRAISPGDVNAKITFNYNIQDDSNQADQVTKSFSFLIE